MAYKNLAEIATVHIDHYNENDPKYFCFCVHVQKVTWIIGFAEILISIGLSILATVISFHYYCDGQEGVCNTADIISEWSLVITVALTMYNVVSVVVLCIGISSSSYLLLFAHLVAELFWIIYLPIISSVTLINASDATLLYILGALYLIFFALEILCFIALVKCAIFFKDKRKYEMDRQNPGVRYQVPESENYRMAYYLSAKTLVDEHTIVTNEAETTM